VGLKNSQYQAIMREYEQKQLRSRDTLARHYAEVYTRSPEFQSLDESISILSVQYGKRLLNGDDHAVESLKSELAMLRKQKDELLRSCGFPSDYLEPSYECSQCRDTGYIDNQKCRCFKAAASRLLYEQSNLKEILKTENFNSFSMKYYSDNYIDPKSGRSSLSVMKDALAVCKDFIRTFDQEHKNLFLLIRSTKISFCTAA